MKKENLLLIYEALISSDVLISIRTKKLEDGFRDETTEHVLNTLTEAQEIIQKEIRAELWVNDK